MMTLSEFAESVYAYCRVYNASVTSWIRTPTHNKDVGGVAEGAHPFGLGADIVYDGNTWPDSAVCQRRANALGLEVIQERTGDQPHDHLQPRHWASPVDAAPPVIKP